MLVNICYGTAGSKTRVTFCPPKRFLWSNMTRFESVAISLTSMSVPVWIILITVLCQHIVTSEVSEVVLVYLLDFWEISAYIIVMVGDTIAGMFENRRDYSSGSDVV